jgi:hypothetical protein
LVIQVKAFDATWKADHCALQVTAIMLGVKDLVRAKKFYGRAWAA